MYFLDSHAYTDRKTNPGLHSTYDWIKPDQVAYYRELSQVAAAAAAPPSLSSYKQPVPVPAIMFFHIPLPEYASAPLQVRTGEKNEAVMASDVNSNLFTALIEMRDVKVTFCGHNHVNDYCNKRQGCRTGGGAGFAQAYGWPDFARRARVLEWTVDNKSVHTLKSWKQLDGDEFGMRQLEETLYNSDE